MTKNSASAKNGKMGGRPVVDPDKKLEIPEITFVILTESQYNTLLEKYGYKLFQKALSILERWLSNSPQGTRYRGKNNYAHFRSDGWVINTAMRE